MGTVNLLLDLKVASSYAKNLVLYGSNVKGYRKTIELER